MTAPRGRGWQDGHVVMALATEADRARLLEAAGRALRVAATAWIAWVLAGLAWLASGHNDSALVPLPARPHRAAAIDTGRLATLNLFGQAPSAPASGAAANAPDTSLQLRLAGVFVSTDPAHSSAIVAERTGTEAKLYRINETLPGGATLDAVYDDRILIKRGAGASEILRFEKTGGLSGGKPGTPAPNAGVPGPRQLLATAVDALNAAPDQFVQQMGLKRNGPGYEISADTPENLRTAIGLQPGDRLVSINGTLLGDPRKDRETLMTLQNGGTARVVIQRGNQTLTLERKF